MTLVNCTNILMAINYSFMTLGEGKAEEQKYKESLCIIS